MSYTNDIGRSKAIAHTVNWDGCMTLLYMLDHPSRYGEFKDFKHAWLHHILCSLRQSSLKQMYNQGLIPSSNSVAMWSHGNHPFVKPMGYRSMELLGDVVFDILHPRVE